MRPAATGRKPTRKPRGRRSPDATTRDRFLEVALRAFAELGYDGASTRTIAARVGVNQGLVPYYFGTKEELWREAVNRAFVRLREALSDPAAENGIDEDARTASLIRRYVRFVAAQPEFVLMMMDEGKRSGRRMRWIVDRHVRPLFEDLAGPLRRIAVSHAPQHRLDLVLVYYAFIGASSALFHQAPECRRLTGREPTDGATVEAQADTLIALFLGTVSSSFAP